MPEYNYWQKKHMYDQMNRTAEKKSAAQQRATSDKSPPSKPYVPPTVSIPPDKDEHIQVLQELLFAAWKIMSDQAVNGEIRERAFLGLDRRMRELGILPSPPKPPRKKK